MVLSAQPKLTKEKDIKARLEHGRPWYTQMDGLRFLAVFAVLIEHFAYFIGKYLHMAYFGVDLFFVISGFLITEGLLREKEGGKQKGLLKRFYLKRFVRIFPIYYLVLFISLAVSPYFREFAGWAFSYTINYYPSFTGQGIPHPYAHLWSLAVEEQFYLFWPLMVLITPKKSMHWMILAVLVASVGYYMVYHRWLELPTRMFSLCAGALLALTKTRLPAEYAGNSIKVLIGLLVAAPILYFVDHGLGLTTLSMALVYAASNSAFPGLLGRFLQHPYISYAGRISYGVYLYHMFIAYLIGNAFLDKFWTEWDFVQSEKLLRYNKWLIEFPLYTCLTVVIAHFSYQYIERPFLKMKSAFV